MTTDRDKALKLIACIPPTRLSYDEWLRVGLALKSSGCSPTDWDAWSRGDGKRFKTGECATKWKGFSPTASPVTVGTLVELARSYGTLPADLWPEKKPEGRAFGWDDALSPIKHAEPAAEVQHWLETDDLPPPREDWKKRDIADYLRAVFEPDDLVGISADGYQKPGETRWLPSKGLCDRTRDQLLTALDIAGDDIGSVIGDTNEAGAWVRINPLDGKGFKDENVTAFRHALLEADEDDTATQLAIIRRMNLPCSAIVHSGGKSIHAIVRVDAADIAEYKARVDYLFATAEKWGLKADTGNRNPSRLTRLPSIERGPEKRPQYLISGKTGAASWTAWVDEVEDAKDGLPDPFTLSTLLADPPALSSELIAGVLRCGHKLVLTGPSKAAKSFALIRLAVAIAEGGEWLGWPCQKGRTLYLNLELDPASCVHRFQVVYRAVGMPDNPGTGIDIWNLRGMAVPLDKLAGKLIRRAKKQGYSCVIIDPIYKVATGDENEARDMGIFCNLIDRITADLGCAVVYAHHHSKGQQGQKRAIDRASGSGVISRDADALVDLVELSVDKAKRALYVDAAAAAAGLDALRAENPLAFDDGEEQEYIGKPQELLLEVASRFREAEGPVRDAIASASENAARATAWRVETILREFPAQRPRPIWFDYPIHKPDVSGILSDAKADGEEPAWKKERAEKDRAKADAAKAALVVTKNAVASLGGVGKATVAALAGILGVSENSTRTRLSKAGYSYKGGIVLEADK